MRLREARVGTTWNLAVSAVSRSCRAPLVSHDHAQGEDELRARRFLSVWAIAAVIRLGATAGCLAQTSGVCPPASWTRESLRELRDSAWRLPDARRREDLALALLPCLASPDPELRDAAAFDALSTWMRSDQLAASTVKAIGRQLLPEIESAPRDTAGFGQPFAALVLSEVARVDRLHGILAPPERAKLLQAALQYLSSVNDYRGFDAREGWRHGVAHGADLLAQLSLNPVLGRRELFPVLAAVGKQAAPAGDNFYTFGEGERLARPVVVLLQRHFVTSAEWRDWIAGLATAGPFGTWERASSTRAGLARRHNLRQFLLSLYFMLAPLDRGSGGPWRDPVSRALETIPLS